MKSFSEYIAEAAMDLKGALKVFGLKDVPKSADELKKLHKKLAMKNHPDRGGSLEKMKVINMANDVLKQYLGGGLAGVSISRGDEPIKQKFQGVHTLRKYGKVFPRGEMPKELPKEEVCRKIRMYIMTFFNECFNSSKSQYCSYLNSMFKEPFTVSISTRQIDGDGFKRLNDIKEPWMTASFSNADGSKIFNVHVTGNSDRMAYKNREELDGYYNKIDFDFEWKVSAEAFKNGSRKVILKPLKFRRKDERYLKDPSQMLPSDKIKKAFKV